MKKQILFLMMIIAVMGVVSGCAAKKKNEVIDKTVNNQAPAQNQTQSKPVTTATGSEEAVVSSEEIDISNWQIYRNDEYGFEVKYPNDWKIVNTNQNRIAFQTGIAESAEVIDFIKNLNDISFSSLKQEKIERYGDVILEQKEMKIDGEKALYISTSEFDMKRIYFIHDKTIFEITTGGRIIKNGVLGTFRFIK